MASNIAGYSFLKVDIGIIFVAVPVSILHLVSIAGPVILPSVSSGNIPTIVKASTFCLCWMLWIAAVCDLAFIG